MEYIKIFYVIVIITLTISTAISFIFISDDNKVENETLRIEAITGNASGQIGDVVTINVSYSDDAAFYATVYYKTTNDTVWITKPILTESYDILLDSNENINYYVTVTNSDNKIVGDPSNNGSLYYTITVLGGNNSDDTEYQHTVFIEEGSFTSCYSCPQVAKTLYELYSYGNYNFYYVTLIKANEKAANRLDNEYNIYGLPTVFIDGGYNVIIGGNNEKSEYAKAIRDAETRKTHKIQVTVNAEYDNNTHQLLSNVLVKNMENEKYSGQLRVYITEKISRWSGPGGEPYHFGFLDYLTNKEISLNGEDEATFTDTIDISDLDPENLMLIAAVFNSENKHAYSDPPENKNPFNAHYADAVDGAELIDGGNMPPTVGFSIPEIGYLHILSRPILETIFKNTILVGRTTITAEVYDDSGVEKVEFYLNGDLVGEDTESPYELSLKKVKLFKRFFRKYTLSCIVYDNEGKAGTGSMDIITIML
jgi:hypothetical protein